MSLMQHILQSTANKIIAFRKAELERYSMLAPSVEGLRSQAKYAATIYLTDQEADEVAHIVMKHFSAKGIRFYIHGKQLYNPYSRSVMSDRPKKMIALGQLLS